MKRIVCTLAAVMLLFTGCGKPKKIILDDIGEDINEKLLTTTSESNKKKRKEVTTKTTTSTTLPLSGLTTAEGSDTGTGTGTETGTSSTAISDTDTAVTSVAASSISTTTASESENTPENTDVSTVPVTTTKAVTTEKELYYLDGVVYDVRDKYILIKESDFSRVGVTVSDKSMISGINIGDVVEITYNGLMNEGYVSYAYDAYSIEVTQKAAKKYEYKKFESHGMTFSLLVPEGWSDRVIEYPQDDDFTDWGIRFMCDGGNMDVSWHSTFQITTSMTRVARPMFGTQVTEYSQSGIWKFIVFDNNYIAANGITEPDQFEKYKDDMYFMLSSLEFS